MARTDHGFVGIYNASNITLANGEGSALGVDVNGILKVNVVTGGSSTAQGTYNTSAPTLTNGQTSSIQLDVNGNEKVVEQYQPQYENNVDGVAFTHTRGISSSTGATSIDRSAALEASTLTKAAPGRVYSAEVRVDSTLATGTYYIQWFNNSSLPADGAGTLLTAPAKIQHVSGSDNTVNFNWEAVGGLYFSVGIVMCISTTEFTKTIGGSFTSSNVYFA